MPNRSDELKAELFAVMFDGFPIRSTVSFGINTKGKAFQISAPDTAKKLVRASDVDASTILVPDVNRKAGVNHA